MEGSLAQTLVALLLFLFSSINTVSCYVNTSTDNKTNAEYIKTSCSFTIYPRLCYNSLSIYASEIQTNPKALASTALNITLEATESTSRMLINISKIHGLLPKEAAAAIADCIEVIGDSVDELQKSIDELGDINNSNFWRTINDVQTWVSAALTDEDTCMDGFEGKAMNANVRTLIRRHMVRVAHFTSNALALINLYASKNFPSL